MSDMGMGGFMPDMGSYDIQHPPQLPAFPAIQAGERARPIGPPRPVTPTAPTLVTPRVVQPYQRRLR
jgi:hypothetical protein